MFVDLGIAILLAIGVESFRQRSQEYSQRGLLLASSGLLAGVVLAAPTSGYPSVPVGHALSPTSKIRPNGIALAYPYPEFPDDQAMLWQALARMRFSLLGGYAIRPDQDRRSTRSPLLVAPEIVPRAFLAEQHGDQLSSQLLDAARRQLPAFVRRQDVTVILVDLNAPGAGPVSEMVTAVYGTPHVAPGIEEWNILP